ncbi:unnamed protein product [Heligmosomoides polygyrus]|uniref:VWFA domain-containing protein n=1 Tax=Heligmosomoides polygyrus TaxID=6339 RepID=A0A3P8IK10_HELPZ|nr:unnamed protein product [Heligmosomoides polygyrus]
MPRYPLIHPIAFAYLLDVSCECAFLLLLEIYQIPRSSTTFIGAALKTAVQLLETRRPSVPTLVILISDGFTQDDAILPAETIRGMRNIEFYAVSISRLSNR